MIAATPENLEWIRHIHLFHDLPDDVLETILTQMEARSFRAGEILTRAGTPCEGICFVRQGKVELLYPTTKPSTDESTDETSTMTVVGQLVPRDYYSEECSLDEDYPNHTHTARASTEGMLYCWPLAYVSETLRLFPSMASALYLVKKSRRQARRRRPKWLPTDEMVYLLLGRPVVALLPRIWWATLIAIVGAALMITGGATNLPALTIAGGGLALFALAIWGWEYIDWSNDYCLVTNRRVAWVDKVILLYESRNEAALSSILSVTTKTTWLGRQLGYGDVVVRTYGGKIIIEEVSSAQEVASIIEEHWQRTKQTLTQRSQQEMVQVMQEELGLSAPPEESERPPEHLTENKTTRSGLLARVWYLLQQRVEENGSIIYRKHWYLLLRRAWLPLLMMFLVPLGIFWLLLSDHLSFSWWIGIGILVTALPFAGWLLWNIIDWRNDYYQLTTEHILDVYRKPFGTEEKQSAPLESIENIQHTRTGLLGWLLNFGNVEIRVGTTTMIFEGVARPDVVQQDIFRRMQERREERRAAEARHEQERLLRWLKVYHDVTRETHLPEEESGV